MLDRAGSLPFPVAVQMEALDAEPDAALDRQLDAFAGRRIPVWLTVPAPARIEDAEPWRASLRRLLERHGRGLTILEVRIDDQPAAVAAFSARVASTEVRAAYDTIRVALGGRRMIDVADREAVYTPDLAPYVDLLVLPEDAIDGGRPWLSRTDPAAGLIVSAGGVDRAGADSVSADSARRRLPDAVLRYAGTERVDVGVAGRATVWRRRSNRWRLLPRCSPTTSSRSTSRPPDCNCPSAPTMWERTLPHRLLFDNQTFATLLAYWGEPRTDRSASRSRWRSRARRSPTICSAAHRPPPPTSSATPPPGGCVPACR